MMKALEIGNITIIERGENQHGMKFEIFLPDGSSHMCSSDNLYRVVLHAFELEAEGINGSAGHYAAKLFGLDSQLWVGG